MVGVKKSKEKSVENIWGRIRVGVPVSWERWQNQHPYVEVKYGVVMAKWGGKDPRLVVYSNDGMHYLRDLDNLRVYSTHSEQYVSAKNLFRAI